MSPSTAAPRPCLTVAAAVVVAVAIAPPARARADARFADADAACAAGDLAGATRLYDARLAASGDAGSLLGKARCQEARGEPALAAASYHQYLQRAATLPDSERAAIEQAISRNEEALVARNKARARGLTPAAAASPRAAIAPAARPVIAAPAARPVVPAAPTSVPVVAAAPAARPVVAAAPSATPAPTATAARVVLAGATSVPVVAATPAAATPAVAAAPGNPPPTASTPLPVVRLDQPPAPRPRRRIGMLITGSALFGGAYLSSVLSGMLSSPEIGDYLFIPVAGPWLALSAIDDQDEGSVTTTGLGSPVLVVQGLLQATGLVLGIVGASRYVASGKPAPVSNLGVSVARTRGGALGRIGGTF